MSPGTVLIVDGQSGFAEETKSMLATGSFEVLTANGKEALQILDARQVDVVLARPQSDSGMSGAALAGRIKASHPETAVMLLTGATDQQIDPAIRVLKKPFTAFTLLQRVQELLAESRRLGQILSTTRERNAALRRTAAALQDELTSVTRAAGESLRQCRRQQSERFCARLRATGAAFPTVLVAEDDPVSRYAVCRFLDRLGFSVLEASNGREALEFSRCHAGRIDILLADIRMPGLNGVEVAELFGTERPDTKILFTTAEDMDLPLPTMRKPFELDDLLAAMVGILSSE